MKRKCPILLLLLLFSTTTAMAQGTDALGIRAGAFLIQPELRVGLQYSDNIYATRHDRESDWITTATPQVAVNSDWNRHALGLNAGITSGMYASDSDENYLDGHIILDGRVDLLRESFFTGKAGFQRLHEARSDPDSNQAGREPATYYRSAADIAYYHGLGRLSASAGAGITRTEYRRVNLREGGSQNLDIRDYDTYSVDARLAYEMHPDVHPFISTSYIWNRYDKSEAQRDSHGYRIGLGTGFDLSGVTSGEVFAGYMYQNYDQRSKINGLWYGMSVLWNVTQITSVQATVVKSIKETTVQDSSGRDSLDTTLKVDHELLRNLLIGAFFDYTYDSYKDVDISDSYYDFGPKLTYLWNMNLSAEIAYTCSIRDSNPSDREYTENKFWMSLTGKF